MSQSKSSARSKWMPRIIDVAVAISLIGLISLQLSHMIKDTLSERTQLRNERLAESIELSLISGNLIHELQKERGLSTALSSGELTFRRTLLAQRKLTDNQLQSLKDISRRIDTSILSPSYSQSLNETKTRLNDLGYTRRQVDQGTLHPYEILAEYTAIIDQLLNLINSPDFQVNDAKLGRTLSAHYNIVRLKEAAGQERALITLILAGNKLDNRHFRRLKSLATTQETYRQAFYLQADENQKETLDRDKSMAGSLRAAELREVVLNRYRSGKFDITPAQWWTASTQRIEHIKKTEDQIAVELQAATTNLYEQEGGSYSAVLIFMWLLASVSLAITINQRLLKRRSRPMRDRLRFALFILLGVAILAVSALIFIFSTRQVEQQLKLQYLDTLSSQVKSSHGSLKDVWLPAALNDINEMASNPLVIENARRLLRNHATGEALPDDYTADNIAINELRQFFQKRLTGRRYQGMFILSSSFISLASMRDDNQGSYNFVAKHYPDLLERVFDGQSVLVPPVPSDVPLTDASGTLRPNYPTMFLAAPIFDENNDIIAALMLRVDPFNEFSLIAKQKRIWSSGETYFFDRYARMLTQSRFEDQLHEEGLLEKGQSSVLRIQLTNPTDQNNPNQLTLMAQLALSGRSGSSLQAYSDYRGAPVIGAWVWDSELNIGIASEVDESEILSKQKPVLRTLLLQFLSLSLVAIGAMWLIIRMQKQHLSNLKSYQSKLELAKERAETAAIAKSRFLATMSHELRTPLNSIIGMLELLNVSNFTGDQRRTINIAKNSGIALSQIINDILDFSKLESSNIQVESIPFDLAEVAESTIELLGEDARRKGLLLQCLIDPELNIEMLGDPVRFRQIILNLVGNAIKFTPSADNDRGQVTLQMSLEDCPDTQSAQLSIRVRDNGIGISAEQQENLFKPFTQADEKIHRQFGGTGLGLSICKNLIELMGGTIECHSELGQGSEFIVTLPFEPIGTTPDNNRRLLEDLTILLLELPNDIERALQKDFEFHGARCYSHRLSKALPKELVSASMDIVISSASSDDAMMALSDQLLLNVSGQQPSIINLSLDRECDSISGLTNSICLFTNPFTISKCRDTVSIAAKRKSPEIHTRDDEISRVENLPSPTEAERSNRLILIVEDNLYNQEVLCRQLNTFGFVTLIANNGEEALTLMQQHRFTLIFTDVHMPIMNGYDFAKEVRRREGATCHPIPIIGATANVLQGEAQLCRESGMNDCITKPISLSTIKSTLQTWAPQQSSDSNLPDTSKGADGESPIQTALLREYLGNDEDVHRKFLTRFVDQSDTEFEALQQALETSDLETTVRLAHKLKSSSRAAGAAKLADCCEALEHAARDSQIDQIPPLGERLPGLYQAVRTYISATCT